MIISLRKILRIFWLMVRSIRIACPPKTYSSGCRNAFAGADNSILLKANSESLDGRPFGPIDARPGIDGIPYEYYPGTPFQFGQIWNQRAFPETETIRPHEQLYWDLWDTSQPHFERLPHSPGQLNIISTYRDSCP